MNNWRQFTAEEVRILNSKPKSVQDKSETKCPCCGNLSIRSYYQEINLGRLIGTTYVWCYICNKFIHFTVRPLSQKYIFNDPLDKIKETQIRKLQNGNWYHYLNSLWEKGQLPQEFKSKI